MVLTGYLGICDLGIRASTGRYIAFYLGKKDYKSLDETIRTAIGFFFLISLGVLFIGIVVGLNFPYLFSNLPPSYFRVVRVILPLLAVNIIVTAISAIFSSILAAFDRFDLFQSINITVILVRAAGTILALAIGFKIVGLAVVIIIASLLSLFGNYYFARKVYTSLNVFPFLLNKQRLRELFRYGIAAFIFSIAYRLINQTDLFLVGTLIGIKQVTIYSIAGMLVLYSWGFIEQIGQSIFPLMQKTAAKNELTSVKSFCFNQIKITLIVGLPIYIGFIFFGDDFIKLWMGVDFINAYAVLVILSIARILNIFSVSMGPTLAATGYVRFNTIIIIIEAVLNLIFSIVFVASFNLGLIGVAAGTLISLFLVRFLVHPIYTCRKLNFSLKQYYVRTVYPGILVLVGLSFCAVVINLFFAADSWLFFIVKVILFATAWILINVFVFLSATERNYLFRFIRNRMLSFCSAGG